VRLNSKANVKTASVAGSTATFRAVSETRGDLQRVTVVLPTPVAGDATVSLTINYEVPVESNTGLAAIGPISSQFLPLSFWYPTPNTPYTALGADTAPFRLTVNAPNIVSSGVERQGRRGRLLLSKP